MAEHSDLILETLSLYRTLVSVEGGMKNNEMK